MLDAGYDAPRIAHLLSGPPVDVLGRTRSDRVMRRPAPSREESDDRPHEPQTHPRIYPQLARQLNGGSAGLL